MRPKEGYHRLSGGSDWRPSGRQREVLDLLADGRTNPEIAAALSITLDGAKWHVGELLAETGHSDRQVLAEWWRNERAAEQRSAFLALLMAWRTRLLLGVTAVTVLVVVLGVVRWRDGAEGGEGNLAQDVPSLDEGFIAKGPILPFEARFEEFFIELTVESGAGESKVDLINATSGTRLGTVQAGYRPMAVARESAKELLVSSGEQSNGSLVHVLDVYDLAGYSLRPLRRVAMPDRINCTTFCVTMVLSNDERYVYYLARRIAPECGQGGDASVCDIHSVVSLDLGTPGTPSATTELPRGCGVPALSAFGDNGAIASCRGQYPAVGGWTQLISPETGGRLVDLRPSQSSFAFVRPSGDVAIVRFDGTVLVMSADGTQSQARTLPMDLGYGPRMYYLGTLALDDDRLFIVFDDSNVGAHDRKFGFVVFDLATMSVQGYGRVPDADYYLPQGDSIMVLRDQRIETLDLKTGRLEVLRQSVGEGVEILLPGW